MPIAAILLAAGASRRLGQPKQLVRIGGETLLGRTLRIVLEAGASPVFVVLGASRDRIAANVDLSFVHPVENLAWEQGIATSIGAGLRALLERHPEAKAALLMVCDQPRLTVEHLRHLMAAFDSADEPAIAASEYAGIAGIPAIFPASQFPSLLALQGDAGARNLLRKPSGPLIAVPFKGGEIDIDAPSDLNMLAQLEDSPAQD